MQTPRFAVALLVSLLVVGAAPFLRSIQKIAADLLGEGYVPVLGAGFVVAVSVVLGWALLKIRDHRAPRYGLLALAFLLMAAQIFGWNRGDPRTDAVERIHFVFYGLLALLYYRAFRSRGGAPALFSVFLAVAAVGAVDEWLQWLVPVRTGDWFDVVLNSYAGLCGLLFALAVDPLSRDEWRAGPGGWRRVADLAALTLLTLACFVHFAHLGYAHFDDELRAEFHSYFTLEELNEVARRRAVEWERQPPPPLSPLQVEDYFRTEAGWRVSYRNAALEGGLLFAADQENRILETYYAPFLAVGHSLSPAAAELLAGARRAGEPPIYRSPSDMGRIWVRPSKTLFWSLVALGVGTLLIVPRLVRCGPRSNR